MGFKDGLKSESMLDTLAKTAKKAIVGALAVTAIVAGSGIGNTAEAAKDSQHQFTISGVQSKIDVNEVNETRGGVEIAARRTTAIGTKDGDFANFSEVKANTATGQLSASYGITINEKENKFKGNNNVSVELAGTLRNRDVAEESGGRGSNTGFDLTAALKVTKITPAGLDLEVKGYFKADNGMPTQDVELAVTKRFQTFDNQAFVKASWTQKIDSEREASKGVGTVSAGVIF